MEEDTIFKTKVIIFIFYSPTWYYYTRTSDLLLISVRAVLGPWAWHRSTRRCWRVHCGSCCGNFYRAKIEPKGAGSPGRRQRRAGQGGTAAGQRRSPSSNGRPCRSLAERSGSSPSSASTAPGRTRCPSSAAEPPPLPRLPPPPSLLAP